MAGYPILEAIIIYQKAFLTRMKPIKFITKTITINGIKVEVNVPKDCEKNMPDELFS